MSVAAMNTAAQSDVPALQRNPGPDETYPIPTVPGNAMRLSGELSPGLGAQFLGYGSILAGHTHTALGLSDGSAAEQYETTYASTYVDLVSRTVTSALASRVTTFSQEAGGTLVGQTTVSFSAISYRAGQLASVADGLTSALDSQKRLLAGQAAGKELEAQLAQLDGFYQADKEQAINSFTDMVGGFLDQYGQPGHRETVSRSVRAVFASFEAKYQSTKVQGGKEEGFYTLAELDFAAVSVSGWQDILYSAGDSDHTLLTFLANRLEFQVETASLRGSIGEGMAQVLLEAGKNAHKKLLEAMSAPVGQPGPGLDTRG